MHVRHPLRPTTDAPPAHEAIRSLERRLRRTQLGLAAVVFAGAASILSALTTRQPEPSAEIRTHRLVVLDDKNIPRIIIGQDPPDTQRRSRAAGITIHDKVGDERGGMSTMDDGSVVLALDAPRGVGSPMRDRIGMMVQPDGASSLLLIDNQTRGVVKLQSDGKGGGGPQVFKWDAPAKKVHIKTLTFDGEQVQTEDTGG